MALAVVIGEVTSVRAMVGTAYGEGDERTIWILRAKRISGQWSVVSSRHSVLGTQP